MKGPKKFKNFLFGNNMESNLEERLIISLTFVAMIMAAMATLINVYIGLSIQLITITTTGSIWLGLLYLAARFKKIFFLTKTIAAISILLLLDLMWINNAGSLGPMSLVLVSSFSVFLFLWEGWKRNLFIVFFIINLIFLYHIESNFSHIITPYKKDSDRIFDFYSGFVINISLSAVLLIYIKRLFNREKIKAIESEKLKTAFLANLSHEIRTPMNSIIGFAEVINKPNLSEEKREKYSKIIVESSNKLISMINDILDMSKIEAGQMSINKSIVNINQLLTRLYQLYELKIKDKGLTFNFENSITQFDINILTDEIKIWQILNNLLNNALKFTSTGSITLKCIKSESMLHFSVSDTGIGIDKKNHNLIFERFRQVEHSNNRVKHGSGLGLTICKNFANILGGRIWIESEINKGSTFYFSLPIILR